MQDARSKQTLDCSFSLLLGQKKVPKRRGFSLITPSSRQNSQHVTPSALRLLCMKIAPTNLSQIWSTVVFERYPPAPSLPECQRIFFLPSSRHNTIDAHALVCAPSSHGLRQAKPVRDSPELFAACFRCGSSNPLLSPFTAPSSSNTSYTSYTSTPAPCSGGPFARHGYPNGSGSISSPHPNQRGSAWGDACTTCRHPFVRSFFNFESLPLVEFQPEAG